MIIDYIKTNEELEKFCASIQNSTWLALDTEFLREKTYYPELALIQIANEDHIACIDPYPIKEFTPLLSLLNNPDIVKIFHSPSQDLELFAHFFGSVPQNIFDTQLSASLLGIGNQISYSDLVNKLCSVQLDKKHTRTDWSKRPLSESELEYAQDDVRYLGDIYHQLINKLSNLQRLSWLDSDFSNLSELENYQTHWNSLWKKLKGNQKLKGLPLQIADLLTQWRERLAQQKNLPKRWVIRDEDIVDLAQIKPTTLNDFKKIRSLKESMIKKHGNDIIQLVEQAKQMPSIDYPKHDKHKSLSANQQVKSDCLSAICKQSATFNDMAITTLASKKDIDNLILGKPSKLSEGWRYEMAGELCQQFLDGNKSISIQEGVVKIG